MNSAVIFAMILLSVVLLAAAHNDSSHGKLVTDVENVDSSIAEEQYTPAFNYKTVMLHTKRTCWRCSSPCSSYACCNDGYPQCCLVNGRCRCCRV